MDPGMGGLMPGTGTEAPVGDPGAAPEEKSTQGLLEKLDQVVDKLEDIESRLGKGKSKKQEKEAAVTVRMELDMLHDQVAALTGIVKAALAKQQGVLPPKQSSTEELYQDVLQLLEA
jgi:hypothetical protein